MARGLCSRSVSEVLGWGMDGGLDASTGRDRVIGKKGSQYLRTWCTVGDVPSISRSALHSMPPTTGCGVSLKHIVSAVQSLYPGLQQNGCRLPLKRQQIVVEQGRH